MRLGRLSADQALPEKERFALAIEQADWAASAALIDADPTLAGEPGLTSDVTMAILRAALDGEPNALWLLALVTGDPPPALLAALSERVVAHVLASPAALAGSAPFMAALPPSLRQEERVGLLERLAALAAAPLDAGVAALPTLDLGRVHAFADLAALWFALARERLVAMSAHLTGALAELAPTERQEIVSVTLGLAATPCLVHADGASEIMDRIDGLLGLKVDRPAALLVEAVLALPRDGAIDVKAHGFAALADLGLDRALALFEAAFLPDPELERHPVLLRAATANRDRLVSPELVRLTGGGG